MTIGTQGALKAEQEDNAKIARAEEELARYRQAETDARAALNRAIESTKIAIQKRHDLFVECEKRKVARRKAGLIEVNPGY